MASIISPLRYPGAKRRLAGYIAEALEQNNLQPDLFIEPFAGSASVSLTLLRLGKVNQIGIADRDPLVSSFWKVVFWDTQWLVDQIQNMKISVSEWKRFRDSTPTTERERALKCIFLNRTSFSGIMAPGSGPIGGFEQTSQYKIDCRFPRERLISRIRQAQDLADRVRFVWTASWRSTLTRVSAMCSQDRLPKGTFYYFDPPFFEKADRLYTFWFSPAEHLRFRDAVKGLTAPWIVSYDSIPKAEELYGHHYHNGTIIKCLYSLAGGTGLKQSEEAIITNLKHLPTRTQLWQTANGR
jgi:DNA adenine methylase